MTPTLATQLKIVFACLCASMCVLAFSIGAKADMPTYSEQVVQAFDSMDKSELTGASAAEQNEFLNSVKYYKARISGGRCESSMHCPGASVCVDRRCSGSVDGGSRCTSSMQCAGASVCVSGRCSMTSDSGGRPPRHCESSMHCPGASVCVSGRCSGSQTQGDRCESSMQCSGASVCMSGRCT